MASNTQNKRVVRFNARKLAGKCVALKQSTATFLSGQQPVLKMEVDTESTNTSAEDKTEDFCENPTRDALTEGLMRLLKPTIDQLDEKIRTIRISQVEFKQQIESLSEELKRINEANSEKDFDLEVHIKKLVTVKQKLTVVSNILQNSEERLLRLQQNIAKESSSQKALLETSTIKQAAVTEPDDSPIQ